MSILFYIILFSIVGSLGSLFGASIFLLFKETKQRQLMPYLLSFATGSLLAAALIGLLPEALEVLDSHNVLLTFLCGILLFFVFEKVVVWRHCHEHNCEVHNASGSIILVGDAFHNFIDGIVIAASFLTSIPLGIATSLSVIFHEIPQELGDFGILLHSGYSQKKALLYNIISGLSTLPGAMIAYYALDDLSFYIPYIMALSASSFIYIALADLLPELHKEISFKQSAKQFVFLVMGIVIIAILLTHSH